MDQQTITKSLYHWIAPLVVVAKRQGDPSLWCLFTLLLLCYSDTNIMWVSMSQICFWYFRRKFQRELSSETAFVTLWPLSNPKRISLIPTNFVCGGRSQLNFRQDHFGFLAIHSPHTIWGQKGDNATHWLTQGTFVVFVCFFLVLFWALLIGCTLFFGTLMCTFVMLQKVNYPKM